MTCFLKWPLGVACAVATVMIASAPLKADDLTQYFFWDRMGNAAGQAVGEYQAYRRERQLWSDNIAAAKAELERCGGCANAQAKLDKWQGIENKFQEVAGSMAASVGMPRVVADHLGINKAPFVSRSPEEIARECTPFMPAWAEQRPAFCQQAVEEHITCLREGQVELGTCSQAAATSVGGKCWQSRKLFIACYEEDYEGFDRENASEALRKSDPTIPEVIDRESEDTNWVLYNHASDDFVLPIPPKEVIDAAFAEKKPLRVVRFRAKRSSNGPLWNADIMVNANISNLVAPDNRCLYLDTIKDEMTKRVCEDFDELRYLFPRVIACWYSSPQGGVPPDAVYLYDASVPLLEPRRLLERDSNHPFLKVGEPRTQCPATKSDANAVAQERYRRLAALGVQQIPETQALPRSAFLQELDRRREEAHAADIAAALAEFPIAGWYAWSMERSDGRKAPPAQCLIEAVGESRYTIGCEGRGFSFTGNAIVGAGGLQVTWQDGLVTNFKDGTSHTTGKDGVKTPWRNLVSWHAADRGHGWAAHYGSKDGDIHRLLRKGNVSPARFVEMVAGFPFEGDYELNASHGAEQVRLACQVERNTRNIPNTFTTICYREDGTAFKAESHPQQQPEGRDVLLYYEFSPEMTVGDQPIRNFSFPIDLAARGEAAASDLEGESEGGTRVRFTRTGQAPLAFTPLEALRLKVSYTERIREQGINTVEELAALSDEEARSRPIGWVAYRDQARALLAAQGTTVEADAVDESSGTPPRLPADEAWSVVVAPEPERMGAAASADQALPTCPRNFARQPDPLGRLDCVCPPDARSGLIIGTGIYSDVSTICTAAKHAGIIDEAGGEVHIQGVAGLDSYASVERNGVRSGTFGAWPRAFRFVDNKIGTEASLESAAPEVSLEP